MRFDDSHQYPSAQNHKITPALENRLLLAGLPSIEFLNDLKILDKKSKMRTEM
jgi:hypothetical protein